MCGWWWKTGKKLERQVFVRNDEDTDQVSASGVRVEETDMRDLLGVKCIKFVERLHVGIEGEVKNSVGFPT